MSGDTARKEVSNSFIIKEMAEAEFINSMLVTTPGKIRKWI